MQLNTKPTNTRASEIDAFLQTSGWGGSTLAPLPGDASFRRYIRIINGNKRSMLMDAPPEKEDVRPFINICNHLCKHNYSAPKCLAQDIEKGFLLLEDLGDDLFAPLLTKPDAALEKTLYESAIDLLADWYNNKELQRATSSLNIPLYDTALLTRELGLFSEWYLPKAAPDKALELAKEYLAIWEEILAAYPIDTSLFVHRDYHANNLLWLKDRAGLQKVGLLDFQDGVWGSPAYDLVSLLEDARRDVSPELADAMLKRYVSNTKVDADTFAMHYALLGAQRNCKILGIFVRLWVRDGKPLYLPHLPRVWNYLQRDLQHPALAKLRDWFAANTDKSWHHLKP